MQGLYQFTRADQEGKPENYRPVSITSHVCKVMERIIKSRIMSHLQDNNLLTDQTSTWLYKQEIMSVKPLGGSGILDGSNGQKTGSGHIVS